jgi:hypothetical protein
MLDFILSTASNVRDDIRETTARLNKSLSVIARNLKLLSHVYVARFIVWRELRRLRKQERAAASLR